MADTHITLTGNLTDDPDLRYTPNGTEVANFRLAVTARVKDGDTWRDGETSFFRVNVWRQLAEHVAESLTKGDRAVVIGRLKSRSWETRGRQALGGRGRGRRGRPLLALGHRQARAGRQRPAGQGRVPRRRPLLASSEAGAAVTRPGLAHHEPSEEVSRTHSQPYPIHSHPEPALHRLGGIWIASCPTCGFQVTTARTQARCERHLPLDWQTLLVCSPPGRRTHPLSTLDPASTAASSPPSCWSAGRPARHQPVRGV